MPSIRTLASSLLPIVAAYTDLPHKSRPNHVSICDHWASQIYGNDTAEAQEQFITVFFNQVFVGNYTTPNIGIAVTGIAAPAVFDGHDVNLLPFFDGALYSSSNYANPPLGTVKIFLDGGGATPLLANTSSNGDPSTNQ